MEGAVRGWSIGFLWLAIVCGGSLAEARKFDFKNESFAGFVRFTAGSSLIEDQAYATSSGAGTSFSDSVQYDFSGELGFLMSIGDMANLRVGYEVIQPKALTGIAGKDSGGQDYFTLDSTVRASHPNATLEFNVHHTPTLKVILFAGAGMADVSVTNAYTMTALGTTDLGPSDFTEEITGQVISWQTGMALEVLFVDNVTSYFELGYRRIGTGELKFKEATTPISNSNSAAAGEVALNNDGLSRRLDMSSYFFSVSFRFYVPMFK